MKHTLPSPAALKKAALVLAAAVVLLWLVLRLRRWVIGEVSNQNAIDEANSEIDASDITYTDAQYNSLASKLYTAVKGWGTDLDAVYAVFEAMFTRSDLMKLTAAFGVKDDMTLYEWIHDDLNQRQIDHVNQILSARNINYTF